MKHLIIFLAFLAVGLVANGQAANQIFVSDSTKGAETIYFTGAKEAGNYVGVSGFVFTTAHDNATIYLQGCYNTCATCWYNIDTVSATGSTAVNQIMYDAPPLYKYYRLKAVGNGGDTCIFTNIRHFLKY